MCKLEKNQWGHKKTLNNVYLCMAEWNKWRLNFTAHHSSRGTRSCIQMPKTPTVAEIVFFFLLLKRGFIVTVAKYYYIWSHERTTLNDSSVLPLTTKQLLGFHFSHHYADISQLGKLAGVDVKTKASGQSQNHHPRHLPAYTNSERIDGNKIIFKKGVIYSRHTAHLDDTKWTMYSSILHVHWW